MTCDICQEPATRRVVSWHGEIAVCEECLHADFSHCESCDEWVEETLSKDGYCTSCQAVFDAEDRMKGAKTA